MCVGCVFGFGLFVVYGLVLHMVCSPGRCLPGRCVSGCARGVFGIVGVRLRGYLCVVCVLACVFA